MNFFILVARLSGLLRVPSLLALMLRVGGPVTGQLFSLLISSLFISLTWCDFHFHFLPFTGKDLAEIIAAGKEKLKGFGGGGGGGGGGGAAAGGDAAAGGGAAAAAAAAPEEEEEDMEFDLFD